MNIWRWYEHLTPPVHSHRVSPRRDWGTFTGRCKKRFAQSLIPRPSSGLLSGVRSQLRKTARSEIPWNFRSLTWIFHGTPGNEGHEFSIRSSAGDAVCCGGAVNFQHFPTGAREISAVGGGGDATDYDRHGKLDDKIIYNGNGRVASTYNWRERRNLN